MSSDVTKKPRVRFAPSPTGYLHIGGLRTALYNKLFAMRYNGTFFLRIEDTDQTRLVPGATEALLKTFDVMGIDRDEGPFLEDGKIVERGNFGPYIQSKRLDIYKKYADELVSEKKAYSCFCTTDELKKMREEQELAHVSTKYDGRCKLLSAEVVAQKIADGVPHVIRFAVNPEGVTTYHDLIRGDVSFANQEIADAVLMKSDGFPTYHLANVVDDHAMEVTHVFRAEEWISSTPLHLMLYKAFGWEAPQFAHQPLLLNADRSKLSKRQGDVAVEDYLRKGYLPQALINFIALQGWNPSGEREVYSMEELAAAFDISKVNSAGAVVNFEKLDWLNRHYIREMSNDAYLTHAADFLVQSGVLTKDGDSWRSQSQKIFNRNELLAVVQLERERISHFDELAIALEFVFAHTVPPKEMLLWKGASAEDTAKRLQDVKDILSAQTDFTAKNLEPVVKAWIVEKGLKVGEVLWPLRVALTGREKSPGPFEVSEALGKIETLARIDHAYSKLTTA